MNDLQTSTTVPVMGYDRVTAALPRTLPAITALEAERAYKRLYRHFCKVKIKRARARRVWISPVPTEGHHKGWGRLIHDVSHRIFWRAYPNKRPHDPLHQRYELDVAEYVVAQGWLEGKLKPKAKPKPTLDEKRAAKLESATARLARWRSKEKRARTAIRKLERSIKRLAA